jgi:hypothetical protein
MEPSYSKLLQPHFATLGFSLSAERRSEPFAIKILLCSGRSVFEEFCLICDKLFVSVEMIQKTQHRLIQFHSIEVDDAFDTEN